MSTWTKSLALEHAFDYCYARITKQLFHSYMCVNQLSFPKKEGEWINRGWKSFKNLHYSQSSAHLRLTSTMMTDLPGKYVLYYIFSANYMRMSSCSTNFKKTELLWSPSSTYTHCFLSTSSLLLVSATVLVTH